MVSTARRKPSAGAALIAHLRDELSLLGHFPQIARLIDGLRQRFLAKYSLVPLHGRRRHNRMHMIRSRNRHRIDPIAHLIQHLAEIFVKLRARIFFRLSLVSLGTRIHVAQRDDVLAGAGIGVAPAFTADSDAGDVQLAVEILSPQKRRHAKPERTGGQRTRFDKFTAVDTREYGGLRSFQ